MTAHDISSTLKERGSKYGDFGEHSRITQNLKAAMADSPNWEDLPDDMKESLEMVAHKIGRILNGDPFYHDSWHDINGYVKLVADKLLPKEDNKNDSTYTRLGTIGLGEQLLDAAAPTGYVDGALAQYPMESCGVFNVQADVQPASIGEVAEPIGDDPSHFEGSAFLIGFLDGTEYWRLANGRVVRYDNPSTSGY